MQSPTLIFETFLDPSYFKPYQYIVEYIERSVRVPTLLLNGEALEDFSAGSADIGVVSAPHFLQLLSQPSRPVEAIAAPLFLGARELDLSFFDIIVHHDSPYHCVEELYRCIWACHARAMRSANRPLKRNDIPMISIREIKETTTQAQALRLILKREVDATSIDSLLFNLVIHNSPNIAARVRSLGCYSLSTSPIVVVASHVSEQLKTQVQEALLCAHHHAHLSPHLQDAQVERFLPLTNIYNRREHRWVCQATHKQRAIADGRPTLMKRVTTYGVGGL
ncbi:PhnD/SsuA/transferrin family substrate-binding protein [Ktedonospora formicarum]|nr:PhnD/SsuA/transferrin family substrate-binding protein [Ktedonospora formicarum]